jgi:DNA polymerase-3 subunit gamma/tau
MAKLALYQKYRSSTFEEVVGQEYIVQSIKNAVRENKVGHAYLFCGPRGTGKTTMARLLAKAVNCENPEKAPCEECANCIAADNGTHPDIIEINAANETHVEDIRDLIERSTLAPMQGKHKVYIIDEVHQLSGAASSALLKTLEEPPANVIFILATTDPQKLLPTIISRCQRYDFTKIKKEQIKDHLLAIAEKEKIEMDPASAEMIAVLAEGGMRDAESIMDQCASYTNDHITIGDIDRIYGLTTAEEKVSLIQDIAQGNMEAVIRRIQSYEEQGIDLPRFTDGMIDILKDCVVYQSTKKTDLLRTVSEEQAKKLTELADSRTCMHASEKLMDAKQRFRISGNAASAFEVACLSLLTEGTIAEEKTEPKKSAPAPIKKAVVEQEAAPAEEEPEQPIQQNEEPKEAAEEKKEAEPAIPEGHPVLPISQDTILALLVQCNKKSKVADENTIAMVKSYGDLKHRRYTSLLEDAVIGASGEDCILLVVPQVIANRINEEKMNRELYFFMKDTMKTDKMLYAVSEEDMKDAVVQFASLMKKKELPEPMKIEKYQLEEKEKEDPEKKVLELFGAENVTVK